MRRLNFLSISIPVWWVTELGLLLTLIGAIILFRAAQKANFKGGFWSGDSLILSNPEELLFGKEKDDFQAAAIKSAAQTRKYTRIGWTLIIAGTFLQMVAAFIAR